MPFPRRKESKTNRISFERNGRSFVVIIEGGVALLLTGMVAMAYVIHLFS